MTVDLVRVLLPAALAFFVGIGITPTVAGFLYRNKLWKPKAGKTLYDGSEATVFNAQNADREVGTPRFGGAIIWIAVLVVAGGLWILGVLFPESSFGVLDFVSRSQTWVPIAVLVACAATGAVDDLLEVRGQGGIRARWRLLVVGLLGLLAALWFHLKLDVSAVTIPGDGPLQLGWLFVVFFVLVVLATYAGGIIDGLDGLSGGIFAIAFTAYAAIAVAQGQPQLAALCATIAGATLAFLWFNIPPARFYLSETGSMALTATLAVVAFMADDLVSGVGVAALPLVALPLVFTVLSVIVQLSSKKLFGRKVIRSAPIHQHFVAIGWSREKVVMRYWVVGAVAALLGLVLALAHRL
ncbi:MAG TPA: phospho-N-acetylmuramoyl-pentapeptide-transferase [Candidatus Paceibacterota bacterium]